MIEKLNNSLLNDRTKSIYDYDGKSLNELLMQYMNALKECTNISNESLNFLTWLKKEGLPSEVAREINELYESGDLAEIITNEVLNSFIDKDEDIFIDGIEIQKLRDDTSETTYWLTTVPKYDNEGNLIKLHCGVSEYYETHPNTHENDGTGTNYHLNTKLETARHFAYRKKATLVSNGGCWGNNGCTGTFINDGVIMGYRDTSNGYRVPLGIKEDNTLVVCSPKDSPQTLLENGIYNSLTGFYPVLVDGEENRLGAFQPPSTYWNQKHPRGAIGQKTDGTILLLHTDGRRDNENGMTYSDVARILKSNGCHIGYVLDGGGSTSLVYRNEFINNKIDNNQRRERNLYSFIYFTKETKTESKLSEDILQITKALGDLRSEVQDNYSRIKNGTENRGYLQLKATTDYQGIEVWTNDEKHHKLLLTKNYIRWYNYLTNATVFQVSEEGELYLNGHGWLGHFDKHTKTVTNIDTLNTCGMYWALASATGNPYSSSIGVWHWQVNSTNAMQVIIPFNIAQNNYPSLYRRSSGTNDDGSLKWTKWVKFNGGGDF